MHTTATQENYDEKVLALVQLLDGLVESVMTHCGSIQQNLRRLMPTMNLLVTDRDVEQLKAKAADANGAMHNVIGSRFEVSTAQDVPGLGTITSLPIGDDEPPPLDDRGIEPPS